MTASTDSPIVVVIMGVSGSGKTTVGRALARLLDAEFHDADDYHPAANIEKMRRGVPLDETDRAPWLHSLRARIDAWLLEPGTKILACSALTARSRAVLGTDRSGVEVVLLHGPRRLIESRMQERAHFMPPALLDSQIALLEPPRDALRLDIREPPQKLAERIKTHLESRHGHC
jgi:gluconokinase